MCLGDAPFCFMCKLIRFTIQNMIVENHIQKDAFAKLLGIRLLEASEGKASAEMLVTEDMINGLGTVQGGALFSLADYTFAAAINSLGGELVTLDATMNFFRPAERGDLLYAEAVPVKTGNTIMVYDVRVVLGKGGKIVSSFRGTAFRKK